jgi:cell division septum initiation protein DivIVA
MKLITLSDGITETTVPEPDEELETIDILHYAERKPSMCPEADKIRARAAAEASAIEREAKERADGIRRAAEVKARELETRATLEASGVEIEDITGMFFSR